MDRRSFIKKAMTLLAAAPVLPLVHKLIPKKQPLGHKGVVGWKAEYVNVVLNEDWLSRVAIAEACGRQAAETVDKLALDVILGRV